MSDAQIFQLFGLSLLAIGLGMLTNKSLTKNLIEEFKHSAGSMYISGLLILTAGYLLVAFHNIWTMSPALIITIFGWACLLKGLVILILPEYSLKISKSMVRSHAILSFYSWAITILSIFFLYLGYLA